MEGWVRRPHMRPCREIVQGENLNRQKAERPEWPRQDEFTGAETQGACKESWQVRSQR